MKNMFAYHITWVTHNSRVSQRMKDYGVKRGSPVILDEKDEILISEVILEIILKDKLKIFAYNICRDHIHIILLCDQNRLSRIVQKMKAISSRSYNIYHRRTIPGLNKGACSLAPGMKKRRGKAQNHLWSQKYNTSYLESNKKFYNAIEYVENNRDHHHLPISSSLLAIIQKMTRYAEYN